VETDNWFNHCNFPENPNSHNLVFDNEKNYKYSPNTKKVITIKVETKVYLTKAVGTKDI
jgi:hypothetical protein